MTYTDMTCRQFTEAASSREPVPGGGSAAALAGALGTALGHMVGSLTTGKKTYAAVEEEITALMKEAEGIQEELLSLVQADIDAFEPLAQLYRLKPESEEEKQDKERRMEKALENACRVPLAIMENCGRAIELCREFADKGSRMALSDAGSGAILCKAALQAASLNVYINTNSMQNRELAAQLEQTCAMHMMRYTSLADEVFAGVSDKLKRQEA